jgi:hypothetical protein
MRGKKSNSVIGVPETINAPHRDYLGAAELRLAAETLKNPKFGQGTCRLSLAKRLRSSNARLRWPMASTVMR